MRLNHFALAGLCLLLVACSVPEEATPSPTQVAVHVQYPSALKPWADRLSQCAASNPMVALYFTQTPGKETATFSEEITLELGESEQTTTSNYAYQVGSEEIVVVVNRSNQLTELTGDQLKAIYSGQTRHWKNSTDDIQVWVLPSSDPVQMIFDRAVLPESAITSYAMLAPDSQAMLEAIASDPNAIGYLPISVLSTAYPTGGGKVKQVSLDDALATAFAQPVIAVTRDEPQGLTRALLVCLQTQIP